MFLPPSCGFSLSQRQDTLDLGSVRLILIIGRGKALRPRRDAACGETFGAEMGSGLGLPGLS
jgi:hypothetical protein